MTQTPGFKIIKYLGLAIGLGLIYFLTPGGNPEEAPTLFQAIESRNLPLIQQLLSQNPSVNQRTPEGAMPLHFAARSGQFPVVKLLIENGADVQGTYQTNWTPLHFAAKGGHVDVARLLVENGADVNGVHGTISPLHVAVQERQLRMASYLLRAGAIVHTPFKDGWTVLHVAAQTGDRTMTKLLLDAGASINVTNTLGITPLHSAALSGHVHLTRYLLGRGATCSLPPKSIQNLPIDTLQQVMASLKNIFQHCPSQSSA